MTTIRMLPPHRPSIVDVARRAGVSASTVSRSLRGTSHVAQETRDRVLRAANELQYVPSPAASRLASGRTHAVGVIVPFESRWFFSEVLSGAEGVLREAGYDLLLYNVGDLASRRGFFASMPLRRRVDAVLVVSSSLDEREAAALEALDVPMSLVGGRMAGRPSVGIDDEAGAATAVRHLIVLGHRDIAMISGESGDPLGRSNTLARRAGFCAALREAGIPERDDRVVSQPWGVTGGVRAMEQLLGRAQLPTAVFAECDEMALGALQTLRRARLDVPGRVSLIGFDDHEMAPVGDLTTISQPVRMQGRMAARMLLDDLEGRAEGDGREGNGGGNGRDGGGQDRGGQERGAEIVLPTRLVVRGSTGPPPAPAA